MAICDEQTVYADLLTTQLLRMKENEFQICKFSTEEQLLTFASKNKVKCLIISDFYESVIEQISAQVYLCLTAEKRKVESRTLAKSSSEQRSKKVQHVYRYQSIEDIYAKIQDSLRNLEELLEYKAEEQETQLIGIYNPVHRNGQTMYAKALATAYGKRGLRVLYLSMEEYAGVSDVKEKGNLGEVLYYLKQDIKSINFRLAAFTKQGLGYEYVEPMVMSQELKNIECEEWIAFLKEIRERSGYELIVLDLDSCIQGLFEILELCNKFYVPIRHEVRGEEKQKQFEENLRRLQKQALKDKIDYKYLPSVLQDNEEEIMTELELYIDKTEGM